VNVGIETTLRTQEMRVAAIIARLC